MLEGLSAGILPFLLALVGTLFLFGKRDLFPAFLRGAKKGLETTVGLLPTLSCLLVGISMLKTCGILEWLGGLLSPVAATLGLPTELLPFLLTRPFSGSASVASLSSLLEEYGADSLAGLCASVIFGSSDTVVYVLTVYTASQGIKKTRWGFPAALAVMIFCWFFSSFLCRVCLF